MQGIFRSAIPTESSTGFQFCDKVIHGILHPQTGHLLSAFFNRLKPGAVQAFNMFNAALTVFSAAEAALTLSLCGSIPQVDQIQLVLVQKRGLKEGFPFWNLLYFGQR